MIPIFLQKEMLPYIDENKTNVQDFIQQATSSNLQRLTLELLLNNFRANSSILETFDLLKTIEFNINNINNLLNFSINNLRGNFQATFLGQYDNDIMPLLNKNLLPNIGTIIANQNFSNSKKESSRNLVDIKESLSNVIEDIYYTNRISEYPFVEINLNNKKIIKFIFIPLDFLNNDYPFLVINQGNPENIVNYLKLFTETVIANINRDQTGNVNLSKAAVEYKKFNSSTNILKTYFTMLKNRFNDI